MNRKIYRMLVVLLCAGILCQMRQEPKGSGLLCSSEEADGQSGFVSDASDDEGKTTGTDSFLSVRLDSSVSDDERKAVSADRLFSVRSGSSVSDDERKAAGADRLSSAKPDSDVFFDEAEENTALEFPVILPRRFDSREQGRIPAIKSQGSYGTCWALAATSALEASLPSDVRTQLSADHMALNNRFVTSLSDGGDYVMVMAYLSGWQGPVLEREDPYGDAYSPDGLSPAVHVQEIRLLEGCTREEVKEAVCQYGAVQTSLYMSRGETDPEKGYYNPINASWYYPQERTQNHDVIILGWDDDYSRFHFSQIPPEDGAFICQNSWGEKFGENGIFYVSYADANIARTGLAYSRIEAADNYDFLYQTDDCGWVGQQGYARETCWFANVYTAQEQDLRLDAFGFYATGPDTVCELYLVHDFENPASFSDMKFLQKKELDQSGYYTIDLDEPEMIHSGERFAMVVKITTPGENHPAAVEYRADIYSQNVTTEGKEGYLSQDGKYWENTGQKFGSNVCLKGYLSYR